MKLQELTSYPIVKLINVLSVLENGSRPAGGVSLIKDGVPSIGGEHITADGTFNLKNLRFIPKHYFEQLTHGVVQRHDVLVVKDGATTGKVAFVNDIFPFERAAINEHIFLMRPNPSVLDPEYLFFFLYSNWGQTQILRSFQGAAIGGINQSFADRVFVPIPSLPEQHHIVKLMREADKLYHLSKKAENTAKSLYRATFEYLFGTGAATPKHPDTIKLKELLKVPLTSGFSPTSDDTPRGIPVLTLAAITDFGLDETQIKYYPVENYQGSGSDLEINDILITRSNTTELVGKVARYKGKPSPVIYPDLTIRIRLKNVEDSAYVENFLRSPHMVSVIRRLARGTSGSMKKISQKDINNFDVLLVSEEERQEFNRQVNEIDEMIARQKLFISKIDKLFSSLLAQAFTGELTARWRGQHEAELIEAARERDALLSKSAVSGAARITSTTTITAEATVTRAAPPEREEMFTALSRKQQRVLDLANSMEGYFTLLQLSQARQEASELSHADIRQGLQLLAALGLLMHVRVATEPIKNQLFFTPVYRRLLPSQDDSRLRDLDRLGANGG